MVLLPVLVLLIMVGALIDIILRSEFQVKHLPKFGWILLVIFLPFIGSVLWFTLGREYPAPGPRTHTGGGRYHSQGTRPAASSARSRPRSSSPSWSRRSSSTASSNA
ncbi:MAG TPA: PLD nuclease N-terminal domain-containing protein [Diaminobutyricibacter sp.]